MASREICKICWNANPVGFTVPDDVWREVVPTLLQQGVVCLSCFTRLGDEKMIPWDAAIQFWPVSMYTHHFDK